MWFYLYPTMHIISNLLLRSLYIVSALLIWSCAGKQQKKDEARVVNIADGDTFTLLYPDNRNLKIRLYGIDAPERAQDFGTAARKAVGQMLEGHLVSVKEIEKDRYGRVVAIAYRDDGLCVNEELLRQGYAWNYAQYNKTHPEWQELEQDARAKRLGLWAGANPTPPWEWRKLKKAPKRTKVKKEKNPLPF